MRDSMKSKRTNRGEGDEEEEKEEEEGKGPAVATTAADSSALAMVRIEALQYSQTERSKYLSHQGATLQTNGSPQVPQRCVA